MQQIKKSKNIKIYIIILFSAFLLNACEKDRKKPSWNAEMLIPLLTDTIMLKDVMDESFFVENPDQSISLVFNEELFEINIDSLAHLPDTLLRFGMKLGFIIDSIVHQPGDTIVTHQFFLPMDLMSSPENKILLEKAILKTGSIAFESYNISNSDLLVSLSIDGVENPETGTFAAVEKVEKDVVFNKTFDVSDYHLNLTGPNNDTINMLTYNVALIVHPDEAGEVVIFPEDSIALNIYFHDIKLNYARGYFGQHTFAFGPEVYPISIFENLNVQGISFTHAEVKMHIKNTYGVEVDINMDEIIARNNNSSEAISLESLLIDSNLFVNRAIEIEEESGNIEPHYVSFDFSNSNFPDLLSIQPDEISYKMDLKTNVMGDSLNYNNFFYDDQPISVSLAIKLNGGLKIDSLFETSRLDWNINGIQLDGIKKGELKLIFSNAFPFHFYMNLYFEDQEMNIIDTLAFHEFIEGGQIGDDGFVAEAIETRFSIPLDEDLKNNFEKAKYTRYELMISTANNEQIMLHKNDMMRFKVVGDFEYLIDQQ